MSKKSNKNKFKKEFSLKNEDVANIYGRLKVIDYITAQIKKDCYDYLRDVAFKRLGIPDTWAIVHANDWKTITVIAPDDAEAHQIAKLVEGQETGRGVIVNKEEKQNADTSVPTKVEEGKQGESPAN